MAYFTKPTFLFIVLFLSLIILSTTTPIVNAEVTIRGEKFRPKKVVIVGKARCTDTVIGSCLTGPPLTNVTVWATLNCKRIASITTNSDGSFSLNVTKDVTKIVTSVGNIIDGLNVHLALPMQECPIYANAKSGEMVFSAILPPVKEIRSRVASGRCVTITIGPIRVRANT